jgi:hypothetical protein
MAGALVLVAERIGGIGHRSFTLSWAGAGVRWTSRGSVWRINSEKVIPSRAAFARPALRSLSVS